MTLTIPTRASAVSGNPTFRAVVLCERDGLLAMTVGPERVLVARRGWRAAYYRATDLLDRGVTGWQAGTCLWCAMHVCAVCKGKHRRCRQRWSSAMRPQWAHQDAAINRLHLAGHTLHCAKRMTWGDGECECNSGGRAR